jgi:hypothetical protein
MKNTSIASEIRPGQKEECANIVADAARKGARMAVDDLVRTGFIADHSFQVNVIEKPDALSDYIARIVRDAVKNKVAEMNRSWREQDGVIYFSVISDGTTGEDWIKRLEGNGFRVGDYAKQVLRSPDFKSTNGVTTEVAVLKGVLFEDQSRITEKIRAEADKRKLSKPNAELVCLIREKFTDKEIEAMGMWYIAATHEPIKDSYGFPCLLDALRGGAGLWRSRRRMGL